MRQTSEQWRRTPSSTTSPHSSPTSPAGWSSAHNSSCRYPCRTVLVTAQLVDESAPQIHVDVGGDSAHHTRVSLRVHRYRNPCGVPYMYLPTLSNSWQLHSGAVGCGALMKMDRSVAWRGSSPRPMFAGSDILSEHITTSFRQTDGLRLSHASSVTALFRAVRGAIRIDDLLGPREEELLRARVFLVVRATEHTMCVKVDPITHHPEATCLCIRRQ